MISEKSIQQVFEVAKTEEVIRDFVSLKRRGVNLIGLCPFHNEKTPSFTVSPAKNIYKCFGCGQAGNAVNFLMEHEQLSYPDAIRYLAKKYGIELDETVPSQEALEQRQLYASLFIVNEFARDFYQKQLFETDLGKSVGLSYFKSRGYTEETIRKFELGFAPPNKDKLTQTAIGKGYNKELLQRVKLTNSYGGDFFRDRVMFTIHNLSGKVVAFAGRILKKDVKAPKYVNSAETDIYHKSKVLYGTHLAKRAIRQEDSCIIVEGYTDVISLHQAGVENVVASSGTSLTIEQVGLIKRHTSNVIILYDGDLAGIKAALRGLDLVLAQGMNVKVVLLPEGEDPDSYIRSAGKDAFGQYVAEQAKDFIFFKTDLLIKEANNDPVKKAELIHNIVGSIAKIPDPIKRSVYVKECANLVGIQEQIIVNETNKLVARQFKKQQTKRELEQRKSVSFPSEPTSSRQQPIPPTPVAKETSPARSETFQEKDLVRILISGGGHVFDESANLTVAQYILSNIQDVLDDFESELYQKVVADCDRLVKKGKKIGPTHFTNHPDPAISKLAVDLLSTPHEYSENWEKRWEIFLQTQKMPDENFFKDSQSALKRFLLKKVLRKCEQNMLLIKKYSAEGKDKKVVLHLKVQQKLNEMKGELSRELGTVILG